MTDTTTAGRSRRIKGRGGRAGKQQIAATPPVQHSTPALKNPFPQMSLFSDDYIEAMHHKALHILSELGIKMLLPEARRIFAAAGAHVDEAQEMVYIGAELVEQALATAPKEIPLYGATERRAVTLKLGNMVFQPGAGAPYASDNQRGRRAGSEQDFRELIQLTHYFDALHMLPPLVELQDVAPELRHYASMEAMLTLSDKIPFIFSRGTGQVTESFELLQQFRGLDDDAFHRNAHCYTIINTNSPRQLDIPMAQGLIDFAKAGQLSIVTPFTLMGAMAPITVQGAITLSHAEALAAITLTQLVRPGAPVCYGTFTSNVDMKSGAPAFGTPEHFQASVVAGQLARRIGLPWRSATGSAANLNDAQAANETQMGMWGCLLGGATVIIHAAGWLEGGLTVGYEKFITDMEVVNMIAALCQEVRETEDELGLSALEEVNPGGHFFGCAHTMARYKDAFYEHLIADLSNYGSWKEAGSLDTDTRANALWQSILQADIRPELDSDKVEQLHQTIAHHTERGGTPPAS